MRSFIACQSMVIVASADSIGHCDASLRTGPQGFVRVADANTLVWPEYKGNGVMASAANITDNPHVGLLFLDFTVDHIGLHVNGTARLWPQEAYPGMPVETAPGRRAQFWVEMTVDEAYVHCSKHIPHLEPGPRPARARVEDSDYFHARGNSVRRVSNADDRLALDEGQRE